MVSVLFESLFAFGGVENKRRSAKGDYCAVFYQQTFFVAKHSVHDERACNALVITNCVF